MKKKLKNQWQDKAVTWIAGNIIKESLFIRRVLQKWEQQLTVRQKKILLMVFCLIGSVYFFFLFRNAFIRWPVPHSSLESIQIRGNGKSSPDTIFGIDKRMKKFRNPSKHKP